MKQDRTSYNDVNLTCEECDGSYLGDRCAGWFEAPDETGTLRVGPCKHVRARHQQELIGQQIGQLPLGVGAATLANYVPQTDSQREALRIMHQWVQDPTWGVYLHGLYGTGKSHLAAGAVREVAQRGVTIAWTSSANLASQERAAISARYERDDIDERLGRADVLVLDDLQGMRHTAWTVDLIQRIVSNRLDYGKVLLVTNQYRPDCIDDPARWQVTRELEGVAENLLRIASRMKALCPISVYVDGPDAREQISAGVLERVTAAGGEE